MKSVVLYVISHMANDSIIMNKFFNYWIVYMVLGVEKHTFRMDEGDSYNVGGREGSQKENVKESVNIFFLTVFTAKWLLRW